jgi:serine phosphatase RsbU (regulator of sigma subunit)
MDIAFCKIDVKNNKMDFAGAHRPLYYLRYDGEFFQYKATLKAVGGIPHKGRVEKPFINHEIELNPGDKFFIFTDGLADQIGGEKGKKYKNKRLRELIMNNKDADIFKFYEIIKSDFLQWKGNYKQIDDVLLIGFEY